ncbi:hypothetical protein SLOPH_951 [Spraguea lophii 42_110]|uniref:Uncharacterized protein n=1 Tax=Spraguea lophii (strain 42_110) TaxID=1358809 RepID=S7XIU9_SPRLO|nr:hypothetical protein SLOPH_951 [Spraguea lophii 42_110]
MMRIARILYYILNVLLVSNRYYIKSSGLMLDRTNMIIDTRENIAFRSTTIDMDKEVNFILNDNGWWPISDKEIASCDLELVSFVVQQETELPTIKGMLCKVTTKDCQIDEISSPCAQHYYAYFILGDKDILEEEDFFKIAIILENVKFYFFDEDQIDINEVVKINNRELELKEKNYASWVQSNDYFLKISKSNKIFNKISVMVQENSDLMLKCKGDIDYWISLDRRHDSPALNLIKMVFRPEPNETEDSVNKETTEKSDNTVIKNSGEQPIKIKESDNKKETENSDDGNIKKSEKENGFKNIISLMSYPQIVLSLILIFS